MIKLRATRNELRAVSRVSENVELVNVFLSRIAASNDLYKTSDSKILVRVGFSEPYGRHEITQRNTLLVKCGTTVTGIVESEDKKNASNDGPKALIEVEFAAEFLMPKGKMPDEVHEIGLPAFARLNGLYICMPYIRQTIQGLTSQMNLQVTLPTLKILPEVENNTKHDKEAREETKEPQKPSKAGAKGKRARGKD